jgi:lysophospholipase L1-like esterase
MTDRHNLFRFLLPVVSVFVALALVELILRLVFPVPYSLERNMYFEADPYLGYRHRPLSEGFYPNGVEARANSLGFRDDEFSKTKAPGTFRILALGDSYTVGANVEQPDVYPQVLERLLTEASGTTVEVINAGVGGYDPFHYATFVEQYAAEYDPDMLLLGFFVGNDAFSAVASVTDTRTAVLGRRVDPNAGKGPSVMLKVWGYENLHIVRALLNRGPSSLQFERERCDEFSEYYMKVQEQRLANHPVELSPTQSARLAKNMQFIAAIRDWAVAREMPLLIALLPDENQVNPALREQLLGAESVAGYDFDMPQESLQLLLESAGITYLDLLDTFRNDSRCLYMDDTHWIAGGHKLAAERIGAAILAARAIPQ